MRGLRYCSNPIQWFRTFTVKLTWVGIKALIKMCVRFIRRTLINCFKYFLCRFIRLNPDFFFSFEFNSEFDNCTNNKTLDRIFHQQRLSRPSMAIDWNQHDSNNVPIAYKSIFLIIFYKKVDIVKVSFSKTSLQVNHFPSFVSKKSIQKRPYEKAPPFVFQFSVHSFSFWRISPSIMGKLKKKFWMG